VTLQVPVDSMQGLEIGSHHGSNVWRTVWTCQTLAQADMNFDGMDNTGMRPAPAEHQDQSQMAAWFDTDL